MIINKTRNRLAALKIKANKAQNPHFSNWRKHVQKQYKNPVHYFEKGLVVCKPENFGLIEITENKPHYVADWYSDNWQDGTYKPCVFVARAEKTKGGNRDLWVFTGYYDTCGECYILEKPFKTWYTVSDSSYTDMQNLDDFEYSRFWGYSNSFAEKEAEQSREAYAKDQAEQDIVQAIEEIHENNKEALALIREIKGKQYVLPVCNAIKSKLADLLQERKKLFKLIATRQDNFWSSAC